MNWPNRIRRHLFRVYFLLSRPMTLGVRGIVLREDEKSVFLVRHTYVPGWHLPGGGVEAGETMAQSLSRELNEEGNIVLLETPELRMIYYNRQASCRDHIALFVIRAFRQSAPRRPDYEIAEADFFPVDDLPEGTTLATRRRLEELFEQRAISQDW